MEVEREMGMDVETLKPPPRFLGALHAANWGCTFWSL